MTDVLPLSSIPLYIFDIDGTLALNHHRKHYLKAPAAWGNYEDACVHDEPNLPVVRTLKMLVANGARVYFYSGRSTRVHWETVNWLSKHLELPAGDVYHYLWMRNAGDCRPDEIIKREWYEAMDQVDKHRLVAIFDDRDKVVAMWRSLGLTCFQVAPGNF